MNSSKIIKKPRLWEVDALRGIAIILMTLFHVIFNLRVFFDLNEFNYQTGFWYYLGRVAAIIFIVLAGVVSSLIHRQKEPSIALQKNSYRGLRLIGLGLIITLVTFIFFPQKTIWFGILHFLGLSILISLFLYRFTWLNVLLALLLFAAYKPIRTLYTDGYSGLIFGVLPPQFSSFDHYALIPWLGYVLIGLALGNWVYKKGDPIIKRKPTVLEKGLSIIGKYSLWIYLIHQPIILGVMWVILK